LDWGFFKGLEAAQRSGWGSGNFLADCRLEAWILLGVTTGLNNQRLGSFEVEESFQSIF
jgi:hypothetical protein